MASPTHRFFGVPPEFIGFGHDTLPGQAGCLVTDTYASQAESLYRSAAGGWSILNNATRFFREHQRTTSLLGGRCGLRVLACVSGRCR
jgi:hypothetical protein